MAVLAQGEGERLAQAPVLVAGQGVAGQFYRAEGELTGALLAPNQFPGVTGALQLRAEAQVHLGDTLTENWVDDPEQSALVMRATELTIGGVPFELGDGTRVVAPVLEAFAPTSPTARWHLHYRSGVGTRFVLFGRFEHGALADGTYDRLLLVTADQVAPTIATAASAGKTKAVVLGIIAAVLAGLTALTLRAALKGTRGRRNYGQVARPAARP
jgi:hypothetical protein